MGILDLILGRLKADAIDSQGPISLATDDLKRKLAEAREAKVKDIYPACRELGNEAITLIPKIRQNIENVKSREIDKGTRGYEIAVQMRQKFLERAPAVLDSIKPMKDANFVGIVSFHNSLNGAIVTITKITSDNRYLFFFFNDEMRGFSKNMKGLCNINDAIKESIESKKEVLDEENKIISLLSGYEAAKKELESVRELGRKLVGEMENGKERADRLAKEMGGRKSAAEEISKSIRGADEEIESLRRLIGSYVYLLEKPMKKFKRSAVDKNDSAIMEEFLSSPLESYVKYAGGENKFKRILKEMKENIVGKSTDSDKAAEKAVQAIDKLMQSTMLDSAVRIIELQGRLSGYNDELKKMKELDREAEVALHESEKKERELQKNHAAIAEMENRIKGIIAEAEELSGRFIGREIGISI